MSAKCNQFWNHISNSINVLLAKHFQENKTSKKFTENKKNWIPGWFCLYNFVICIGASRWIAIHFIVYTVVIGITIAKAHRLRNGNAQMEVNVTIYHIPETKHILLLLLLLYFLWQCAIWCDGKLCKRKQHLFQQIWRISKTKITVDHLTCNVHCKCIRSSLKSAI